MRVFGAFAAAFAALTASSGCKAKKDPNAPPVPVCRSFTEARVESARILRAPVLCEGDSVCRDIEAYGGFTCVDNRGGLVTCPPDKSKPCSQNAGPAELAPPLDANPPKD